MSTYFVLVISKEGVAMLYQIIGHNDARRGCFDTEVLLGCIRIDEANLVRQADCSKFAFYAFRSHEEGSATTRNCAVHDKFLVVSGSYPHMPETQNDGMDRLFFYPEKNEKRQKVWKFLKPGHNGHSQTGLVVWGTEALTLLMSRLRSVER